jgi:hypothetical protein
MSDDDRPTDDLGLCPVCGATDRDRRTPLENFVADAGLLSGQALAAHSMAAELDEGVADGRVTTWLRFDSRRAVVTVGVEHVEGGMVPVGHYDLHTGTLTPVGPDPSS